VPGTTLRSAADYSAAKAGVDALTVGLAKELGGHGITIAPTIVWLLGPTPLTPPVRCYAWPAVPRPAAFRPATPGPAARRSAHVVERPAIGALDEHPEQLSLAHALRERLRASAAQ
jgi:NAD(P)-dependent dehydrogenase (short-subunit alcohol dehydrogenase family)